MTEAGSTRGAWVARTMARSWRPDPPAVDLGPEVWAAIAPILAEASCLPLACRRLSAGNREYRCGATARDIVRGYMMWGLHVEHEIVRAFTILRSEGIEPILAKGWAISRLYPEPGLRVHGDIDLFVAPAEFRHACTILTDAGLASLVDLHIGLQRNISAHLGPSFPDERRFEDVYDASRTVRLHGVDVRLPSAEDHLALICVHFLGRFHDAWRPLWLCDVAVKLESLPSNFDWGRCLGSDPQRARVIGAVIELAHRLLGARVESVPATARPTLPRWLPRAVLEQWSQAGSPYVRPEMIEHVRRPQELLRALQRRWPSPIQATMRVGAPLNDFPRLPLQALCFLMEGKRFLGQAPGQLRGKRPRLPADALPPLTRG